MGSAPEDDGRVNVADKLQSLSDRDVFAFGLFQL